MIAACLYRLVMMGKELSKKFTPHVQMFTVGVHVIVTQITTAVCGNVATVHTAVVFRMQSFNAIIGGSSIKLTCHTRYIYTEIHAYFCVF